MNVVRNKQAMCAIRLSYNTHHTHIYYTNKNPRAMKGCIIEIHSITNRDDDFEDEDAEKSVYTFVLLSRFNSNSTMNSFDE